ncbi:hypothetical protein CMK19_01250 [Candidatus Poribacteria bacterium]|nr:hypothetical protein [Candidatus Poribacteria bacterium]|tara:strand:- start:129 stop:986 length:858 start_codon:yes stop_codon:yes gene_type:complete
MKKVGIVGFGYVGKAMARFFRNHYSVLVYDPAYDPADPGSNICDVEHHENVSFVSRNEINTCEYGIVCVPTPASDDGECDASLVEDAIEWLKTPLILIKSTVSVGTTARLRETYEKRIVFAPEYCGESSYWTPYDFHTDVKCTPFFTFGGNPKDTSAFIDLYMPVVGPTKQYRQTTSDAAEMAKYMENIFYASKIVFCYEMSEICSAMDIDYNEVRELWLLDPRINPMHTAVFPENKAPFAGKCLPKDTNALVTTAEKYGYSADLIKEVLKSNKRIKDIRSRREE